MLLKGSFGSTTRFLELAGGLPYPGRAPSLCFGRYVADGRRTWTRIASTFLDGDAPVDTTGLGYFGGHFVFFTGCVYAP